MNEHQSYYNIHACRFEECTEKCFYCDPLSLTLSFSLLQNVYLYPQSDDCACAASGVTVALQPTYTRRKRSRLRSEENFAEMLTNWFRSIPVCNKSVSVDANDIMDIPTLLRLPWLRSLQYGSQRGESQIPRKKKQSYNYNFVVFNRFLTRCCVYTVYRTLWHTYVYNGFIRIRI